MNEISFNSFLSEGKCRRQITHGSLFSGIGGFDLASEWMGWENVFHCEWNEFGQKVLKHYWPKAISYDDITKTDFTIHRGKIDILTGGFPCQPYSMAGKRKGKEDERHLWPEMLRAIREIKPRYVVGENVSGLLNWNGGLVFNEVQADLETEGYKVQPCILPACAVNAPHRRDRVWFVAYANECKTGPSRTSGETESNGSENNDEPKSGRQQAEQYSGCSNVHGIDINSKCEPNGEYNGEESEGKRVDLERNQLVQKRRNKGSNNIISSNNQRTNTNPELKRQQEQGQPTGSVHSKTNSEWKASWSYNDDRWPTQSPICSGDDGVSNRLDGITFSKWRQESIKAYGNAIVPQIAHQIFKALMLSSKL